MSRSARLVFLGVIILFAIALRAYQLTARSIWFDEAFTWRLIQFPFSELISRTSNDVHPPFYYLVLKLWALVFGASLLSLRAFSVAVAALLMVTAHGFMRDALRRPALALVASLFIALSPWQIALNTEARMYTLAALLSLGMIWALSRRQWILFTVAAITLAYTHYYGLLVIAATGFWLLGYLLVSTRARLGEILTARLSWYAVASYAAIAVAYVPWLPVLVRQTQQVSQAFWIPPLTRWSLPETIYRMLAGVTAEPQHHTFFAALLTTLPLLAVIFLFVLILTRKESRAVNTLLIVTVVGTFAFSIFASLVSQSIYQDRYFLLMHSFLLLLIIIGLGLLKPRWLSFLAISIFALFLTQGTYRHYVRLDLPHRPGVSGAIAQLAALALPGEPVIVSSSFIFFPVLYYQQEEFAKLSAPRLYSESPTLAHFAGGPILRPADIIGAQIFQDPTISSLWVIDTSGFGGSNVPVPASWVKTSAVTFPEVFPYQGDIFIKHYSRVR